MVLFMNQIPEESVLHAQEGKEYGIAILVIKRI
jgi:hypothetical protein